MKWAALGFAVTLTIASGAASAESTSQTINLTVVSRCGISVVLKRAGLNMENGRSAVDVPLTRVGSFFYTGKATVAPGRYFIGASTGSTCWGGSKITVLPGHDRDVGIEVTPLGSGHDDTQAFLYGTLPFGGFLRGTLIGKKLEDSVEIDRDAYYIEHAYPGNYLLKLSYGDSLECRIPVVIPKQGMRLDISLQRAQRCIGFPYRYPGTGKRGFIPLFPSPSPRP